MSELQEEQPVSPEGQDAERKKKGSMLLQPLLPLSPHPMVEVLHAESQGESQSGKAVPRKRPRPTPKETPHLAWREGVGNIFQVYARADRLDREFGDDAYANYQYRIFKISDGICPLRTACGMFAALSPNVDEANNFLALERVLDGYGQHQVQGYNQNYRIAKSILDGKDPAIALLGLKTRAFFECLVHPNNNEWMVVDYHMYSVWTLRRHFAHNSIKLEGKRYDEITKDFRTVAGVLDISMPVLQATCWSTWKRINNIVFDSQLNLIE